MVCCVMIAGLLGLFLRPWGKSPLAWRPEARRAQARLASFGHAFAGLGFLVRNEANMRIHCLAAGAVILAGVWLGIGLAGWRWLVIATALVAAAEALNTGVEQACNAVSPEPRPEIKAAKDVAAAGVLIGASVFVPAIIDPPLPLCGGDL